MSNSQFEPFMRSILIAGFMKALTKYHIALGNRATRGGAIFSGMDCVVSINHSHLNNNTAVLGGCFHGNHTFLTVKDCACQENLSSRYGGCFYIALSNATLEGSQLSLNHANNSGGGIYAFEKAYVHIRNTSIVSNSASVGGGIAFFNDARLLCVSCLYENNTAKQGGGFFIFSHRSQLLLAQLVVSTFRENKASSYGGIHFVLLQIRIKICYRWNGSEDVWNKSP